MHCRPMLSQNLKFDFAKIIYIWQYLGPAASLSDHLHELGSANILAGFFSVVSGFCLGNKNTDILAVVKILP